MKIFDCFTFFNELELLELRLMELNDTVDFFVLVESDKTHTGKSKEFIFENNKNLFKKYLDKIIHVKVTDLPLYNHEKAKLFPDKVDWTPENFQRNCIQRGLIDFAKKGDKILISDLDEIPNTETILKYKNCNEWITFEQSLFYYFVNCLQNQKWCGTIMADYGSYETPQQLRNFARASINVVVNGGWHYSFMGGADRIKTKIENIAESSLIIDKIGDKKDIEQKINTQTDLWNRKEMFAQKKLIDIKNNSPKKMLEFLKKYPNLYYGKYNEND